MSIILSKKLEDEVLKDNFPSSFSIEPRFVSAGFLFYLIIVPSQGAPAAFDSSVSICIARA